jgi:hypothetical protein
MINFASSWSYFYPCKQCGLCCQNPPLVKIIDDKAYYLPKGKDGYCIMFDKKRNCAKFMKSALWNADCWSAKHLRVQEKTGTFTHQIFKGLWSRT